MGTYDTLDVYLAAYLEREGFDVTLLENRNGRVLFSFVQSDDLNRAIDRYEAKAPMPAIVFANAIKDLKRRMHTANRERGFQNGTARR